MKIEHLRPKSTLRPEKTCRGAGLPLRDPSQSDAAEERRRKRRAQRSRLMRAARFFIAADSDSESPVRRPAADPFDLDDDAWLLPAVVPKLRWRSTSSR